MRISFTFKGSARELKQFLGLPDRPVVVGLDLYVDIVSELLHLKGTSCMNIKPGQHFTITALPRFSDGRHGTIADVSSPRWTVDESDGSTLSRLVWDLVADESTDFDNLSFEAEDGTLTITVIDSSSPSHNLRVTCTANAGQNQVTGSLDLQLSIQEPETDADLPVALDLSASEPQD